MFKNLFKKNKTTELYAPLSGKVVPLDEVPDPVFSQKMMGEGIAIMPTDHQVVSPVDGEVVQIPDTKHAIGLRDENNNEILIHIGLETVELNGNGFTTNVQAGTKVKVGQPLMDLDLDYLQENAKDTITPIVITNSSDNGKDIKPTDETEAKAGETVLMEIG